MWAMVFTNIPVFSHPNFNFIIKIKTTYIGIRLDSFVSKCEFKKI